MIFSVYRTLLFCILLIGLAGFLSLTTSSYGPALREHIPSLGNAFSPSKATTILDLQSDEDVNAISAVGGDYGQGQDDYIPMTDGDDSKPVLDENFNQPASETTPGLPDEQSLSQGEWFTEQQEGQITSDSDDWEEPLDDNALESWQNDILEALDEPEASADMTETAGSSDDAAPPDFGSLPDESDSTSADLLTSVISSTTSEPRYVFTFGDSLTALGFSMEGEMPSHDNPFGNPPFPGDTSSGGPNWLDDLILASPEDTLCYNFATGAAVVDIDIVRPLLSLIPFPYQVANFTNKLGTDPHPSFANWTADNSLAIIWLGVNDVSVMQVYTNKATPTDIINRVMESYFEKVSRLHAAGLKRFVFMGVPPLYRFPFTMKPNEPYESRDNLTFSCHYWNEALEEGAREFKSLNPDVKADVVLVDPFFNQIIDNPRKYGALNATCTSDDGLSCLFVDGLHPGVELAKSVASGVHDFIVQSGFYD